MKKSKLNLIIDAFLLLCIAAIAGIGSFNQICTGSGVSTPGDLWPKCKSVVLRFGPPSVGNNSFYNRPGLPCFAPAPYYSALDDDCGNLPETDTESFCTLDYCVDPCLFDDSSLYFFFLRKARSPGNRI